jgi:hypothetical protein
LIRRERLRFFRVDGRENRVEQPSWRLAVDEEKADSAFHGIPAAGLCLACQAPGKVQLRLRRNAAGTRGQFF